MGKKRQSNQFQVLSFCACSFSSEREHWQWKCILSNCRSLPGGKRGARVYVTWEWVWVAETVEMLPERSRAACWLVWILLGEISVIYLQLRPERALVWRGRGTRRPSDQPSPSCPLRGWARWGDGLDQETWSQEAPINRKPSPETHTGKRTQNAPSTPISGLLVTFQTRAGCGHAHTFRFNTDQGEGAVDPEGWPAGKAGRLLQGRAVTDSRTTISTNMWV